MSSTGKNSRIYERKSKANRPIRRSALISPWGIGAMVDFPKNESLMTAGLDAWPNALEECPPEWEIIEERLQKRLKVDHFRLPPDFRGQGKLNNATRIPFIRFPQWHYCARCGSMEKLTLFGDQRRCDGYTWNDGLKCTTLPAGKRPWLMPVRFVAVCEQKGHIQDFPFKQWVHKNNNTSCSGRLRLRAGRSAAGLRGTEITCSCGKSASMMNAFNENSLNQITNCTGQRPWLGEMEEGPDNEHPQFCGSSLRVVQRGASNVYFPHVASSIYLPLWGENTRRSVTEILEDSRFWKILKNNLDGDTISLQSCKVICELCTWLDIRPDELQVAAQRRLDNTHIVKNYEYPEENPYLEEERFRYDEYEAMRTGKTILPELEMDRRSGTSYDKPILGFFRTITLVRRLRETRALYGFSRYLPDNGYTLDEKKAELRRNSSINWLPALVTRGEGIFFEVDDVAIAKWISYAEANCDAVQRFKNIPFMYKQRTHLSRPMRLEFIMLHTLAHLLINQLVFDCGYSSSSLRERIYCSISDSHRSMNGFLIYTAAGDADGTMGGLVRQGERGSIEYILKRALQKARWCSYDPVCAESQGQGPDNCNLAACHSCALLPETSCEEGNRLLDRITVVGLPKDPQIGFLGELLSGL